MKRMHISAEPGTPSTLWISDSGKAYATKKEAETDQGTVLDPDKLEIKTNWFKRNWKTLSIAASVSLIVVGAAIWYFVYYKK